MSDTARYIEEWQIINRLQDRVDELQEENEQLKKEIETLKKK